MDFSGWYDLVQFEQRVLSQFDRSFEEVKLSQVQIRYSSRIEDLSSGKFDSEFSFNQKMLKSIKGSEKIILYIIARIVKIREESFLYSLFLERLEDFYKQTNLQTNERYFYLSSLTDEMFCYEIDTILWNQKSRRDFYRKINTPIGNYKKEKLTLIQFYQKILESFDLKITSKQTPKRKVRHKGYRDHGTLGSDVSRTNRDQRGDWELVRNEQAKQADKDNLLNFLWGLGGWI